MALSTKKAAELETKYGHKQPTVSYTPVPKKQEEEEQSVVYNPAASNNDAANEAAAIRKAAQEDAARKAAEQKAAEEAAARQRAQEAEAARLKAQAETAAQQQQALLDAQTRYTPQTSGTTSGGPYKYNPTTSGIMKPSDILGLPTSKPQVKVTEADEDPLLGQPTYTYVPNKADRLAQEAQLKADREAGDWSGNVPPMVDAQQSQQPVTYNPQQWPFSYGYSPFGYDPVTGAPLNQQGYVANPGGISLSIANRQGAGQEIKNPYAPNITNTSSLPADTEVKPFVNTDASGNDYRSYNYKPQSQTGQQEESLIDTAQTPSGSTPSSGQTLTPQQQAEAARLKAQAEAYQKSQGQGAAAPPYGSTEFTPSYKQAMDKGVKLPYRPGGYTEEDLAKYGQRPSAAYEIYNKDTWDAARSNGKNMYEGYYYWQGKYYPIDQHKAEYAIARGASKLSEAEFNNPYVMERYYEGYNSDVEDFIKVWGAKNIRNYRPDWRTVGGNGVTYNPSPSWNSGGSQGEAVSGYYDDAQNKRGWSYNPGTVWKY